MDKLQKAREIIDKVDSQMAELFIQRMKAVETVFEYKKTYGLPIYDKKREERLSLSKVDGKSQTESQTLWVVRHWCVL